MADRHIQGDCLCMQCRFYRTKTPLPPPPPPDTLPNLFLFTELEVYRLDMMVDWRDRTLQYVGGPHDGADRYPHYDDRWR